uniref:Uncharacterized protein n=1 Tax=Rhizophora mucronata TaxID=61149 RepID=A0A2P2NZD7_RHIMU
MYQRCPCTGNQIIFTCCTRGEKILKEEIDPAHPMIKSLEIGVGYIQQKLLSTFILGSISS